MPEHFSRSTVSAAFHCSKCGKTTQHRIDFVSEQKTAGRKGPCLECIRRLDLKHEEVKAPVEMQEKLFT